MRDDLSKSISQRSDSEKDAENNRIKQIFDELTRRCQLYEEESGNGKSHVNALDIEQRVAEIYAKENQLWIPMPDLFDLGLPGPSHVARTPSSLPMWNRPLTSARTCSSLVPSQRWKHCRMCLLPPTTTTSSTSSHSLSLSARPTKARPFGVAASAVMSTRVRNCLTTSFALSASTLLRTS